MSLTVVEYVNQKINEMNNYYMPVDVEKNLQPHTLVMVNKYSMFVPLSIFVPLDHIYEFAGELRRRGYKVDIWERIR